ncbi:MAG: hypothetical protein ACYC27_07825 [Armatimonadota bacterium]
MRNIKNLLHKILSIILLSIIIIALPSSASANVGIPTIACISPAFWFLLPFVIIIEGIIAALVIRRGAWIAIKVAALSNIFSTLCGVPLRLLLTSVFVYCANLSQFADKLYAFGTEPDLLAIWDSGMIIQKIAFSIVSPPGFIPGNGNIFWSWLSWGILLVPFFLISVLTEYWIALKLLKNKKLALRWAWISNAVTYIAIFALHYIIWGYTWWYTSLRHV